MKLNCEFTQKGNAMTLTTLLTKILPLIGCLWSLGGCVGLRGFRIIARLVGDPIAG